MGKKKSAHHFEASGFRLTKRWRNDPAARQSMFITPRDYPLLPFNRHKDQDEKESARTERRSPEAVAADEALIAVDSGHKHGHDVGHAGKDAGDEVLHCLAHEPEVRVTSVLALPLGRKHVPAGGVL